MVSVPVLQGLSGTLAFPCVLPLLSELRMGEVGSLPSFFLPPRSSDGFHSMIPSLRKCYVSQSLSITNCSTQVSGPRFWENGVQVGNCCERKGHRQYNTEEWFVWYAEYDQKPGLLMRLDYSIVRMVREMLAGNWYPHLPPRPFSLPHEARRGDLTQWSHRYGTCPMRKPGC